MLTILPKPEWDPNCNCIFVETRTTTTTTTTTRMLIPFSAGPGSLAKAVKRF
jgi:hypothetical protein